MASIKSKGPQTVHCEIKGYGKGKFESYCSDGHRIHKIELSTYLGGHSGQHLPLASPTDNEVTVSIYDNKGDDWKPIWNSTNPSTYDPIDEGETLVLTIGGEELDWNLTLDGTEVASSSNASESGEKGSNRHG